MNRFTCRASMTFNFFLPQRRVSFSRPASDSFVPGIMGVDSTTGDRIWLTLHDPERKFVALFPSISSVPSKFEPLAIRIRRLSDLHVKGLGALERAVVHGVGFEGADRALTLAESVSPLDFTPERVVETMRDRLVTRLSGLLADRAIQDALVSVQDIMFSVAPEATAEVKFDAFLQIGEARILQEVGEELEFLESLFPSFRDKFLGRARERLLTLALARPHIFQAPHIGFLQSETARSVGEVLNDARKEIYHSKWAEFKALNRRAYWDFRDQMLDAALRRRQPYSQGFVDLDRFKFLNDRFGQDAGDFIIAEAFRRILSTLRATDIVSAYGGEEIVIGMPNTNPTEARAAMRKVQNAFTDKPFVIPRRLVPDAPEDIVLDGSPGRPSVTASIGIDTTEPDQLSEGIDPTTHDAAVYDERREACALLLDANTQKAMKAVKEWPHDASGRLLSLDEAFEDQAALTMRPGLSTRNGITSYADLVVVTGLLLALDRLLDAKEHKLR